jgi:hypothetical protein
VLQGPVITSGALPCWFFSNLLLFVSLWNLYNLKLYVLLIGRYKSEKMLLDGWPTVGRHVPRSLTAPAPAAPAGPILAAAAAAGGAAAGGGGGAAGGGAAAAAAAGGGGAAAAAAAGGGGGAAAAAGGGNGGAVGAAGIGEVAAGNRQGADSWDPPAWPVIEKEGKARNYR